MEMTSVDMEHRRFRTRWRGLDPQEVEAYCRRIADDAQDLQSQNSELKKGLQEAEKELIAYKEREKSIRNVLLHAHKSAEQMKDNAGKEAKLIVAEAELEAEKILQAAHQRLARLNEDIAELKRQKIQLETKLRSTIDAYRQLLDMEKED